MNLPKLPVWDSMARMWRMTAVTWRRYMRSHATCWRQARRTGHHEAAAASLSQAVMCRRQWALALQKAADVERRAA